MHSPTSSTAATARLLTVLLLVVDTTMLASSSKRMASAFVTTPRRLSLSRTAAASSTTSSSSSRRGMSASTQEADATTTSTTGDFKYDFTMEDVVGLCKRRGLIFPSSEIYNGMAGFYDYGPLGSELKKNVKDAWWRYFVTQREDVVGLDSSIIHNPTTWKSSGT